MCCIPEQTLKQEHNLLYCNTKKQTNISRQVLNDQLFFYTLQPASISLNTVTFLASFTVLRTIHAQLTGSYMMLYLSPDSENGWFTSRYAGL